MIKDSTSYKAQIKRLEKQYQDLRIYENDDLTRQFHIVSAGLLNYLPEIPFRKHEEIFKNILLHQRLSMIEQDALHLLKSMHIKNFTAHTEQLLKKKACHYLHFSHRFLSFNKSVIGKTWYSFFTGNFSKSIAGAGAYV